MSDLGEPLNTVQDPINPCPRCGRSEPMRVYLTAVRWACGQTRPLPPIAPRGGGSPTYSRAVKRCQMLARICGDMWGHGCPAMMGDSHMCQRTNPCTGHRCSCGATN